MPRTKMKQWKWKSTHLVKDEEASLKGAGERIRKAASSAAEQSQEQEKKETEILNEKNHLIPISK